jgi:DNA polymerase III subunit epsilon
MKQTENPQDYFLQLKRPIIFFDLETTGKKPTTDRIVELCAIKVDGDGRQTELYHLINPTIPISKGAIETHGITDEMVQDKPTFKDLAPELAAFFKDCDLGGFNIARFDVPMLLEEFHRCKLYPIKHTEVKIVDALSIYHAKEPRNLSAAVKFYCDEVHEGAHAAKADVLATINVLKHQLLRYEDIEPNADFLHQFVAAGDTVDLDKKFIRDENGQIRFNFGKHEGQLASSQPGFLQWIIDKDFSFSTKSVATRILKNLEWEQQIKVFLENEGILQDVTLTHALLTTVKFEQNITPFQLTKEGRTTLVAYNKPDEPVLLKLQHPDAIDILLRQLETHITSKGILN